MQKIQSIQIQYVLSLVLLLFCWNCSPPGIVEREALHKYDGGSSGTEMHQEANQVSETRSHEKATKEPKSTDAGQEQKAPDHEESFEEKVISEQHVSEPLPEQIYNFQGWSRGDSSQNTSAGIGVVVDAHGNIIITGFFSGTMDFGRFKLSPQSGQDLFVAKLNSKGQWLWARFAGSKRKGYSHGIAVDSQGDIIVIGEFNGRVEFGKNQLNSKGGADVFVAKISASGKWLWAKSAGSIYGDRGNAVAVDKQGNIFITGRFQKTADFGGIQLKSQGINVPYNLFVAKLDSKGKWLWAKRKGALTGRSIAIDTKGNIVLTGWFYDTADFGGSKLASTSKNHEIFAAKLDGVGSELWVRRIGAPRAVAGYGDGIVVDAQDNIILSGILSHSGKLEGSQIELKDCKDTFIAKLASSGNWLWAKCIKKVRSWHINDPYKGKRLNVDAQGNIFITGYFEKAIQVGESKLISHGGLDIFVGKLDSSGKWLWAKHAGSKSSDVGNGLVVDKQGNVVVTGYFEGTADFKGSKLISKAYWDTFVWKFR